MQHDNENILRCRLRTPDVSQRETPNAPEVDRSHSSDRYEAGSCNRGCRKGRSRSRREERRRSRREGRSRSNCRSRSPPRIIRNERYRTRSRSLRGNPFKECEQIREELKKQSRVVVEEISGDRVESGPSVRDARSRSPIFTTKDVFDIINSLKLRSATEGNSLPSNTNMNYKNILPEFNPSLKNQRMDIWIKKVNECASVYGWNERTTVHFAMQKLQGLAKVWYESQSSILFNWAEWQQKLLSAFPCEQNYGQSLEDMLHRKSRYNEPLEIYYYEKLGLLNQCDIRGKRAAECIIHGLTDRTIRSSANTLRCTEPDQLLQFLISNQDITQSSDKFENKNRLGSEFNKAFNNNPLRRPPAMNNTIYCFNCKEEGHPFSRCPKPLIRCSKCNRYGHNVEACYLKKELQPKTKQDDSVPKTVRISTSNTNTNEFSEDEAQ